MSFVLTFSFPSVFKAAYADSCSCLVVYKGQQQVLETDVSVHFITFNAYNRISTSQLGTKLCVQRGLCPSFLSISAEGLSTDSGSPEHL